MATTDEKLDNILNIVQKVEIAQARRDERATHLSVRVGKVEETMEGNGKKGLKDEVKSLGTKVVSLKRSVDATNTTIKDDVMPGIKLFETHTKQTHVHVLMKKKGFWPALLICVFLLFLLMDSLNHSGFDWLQAGLKIIGF